MFMHTLVLRPTTDSRQSLVHVCAHKCVSQELTSSKTRCEGLKPVFNDVLTSAWPDAYTCTSYICIQVLLNTHTQSHTHMRTHAHAQTHAHVHPCIHACTLLCVCVRVYVFHACINLPVCKRMQKRSCSI